MARPRKIKTPPKEITPTCVIYTRVSSKEQAQEGFSLDAQLRVLTDYAQAKGFEVLDTIVEIETAKKAGRREFNQMIRTIQDRKIGNLVVEKTDRAYRNFKDQIAIGDLIEETGLHLHLVVEREVIHKNSPAHQKFVHDLKLILAKNYIDNLSDEVKKGMYDKVLQGLWPSVAPLGYRNVLSGSKRIIVPDPKESPIITEMFAMYSTGQYSIKTAGHVATTLGLVSRKGKRIPISSLHVILTNPIYMGVIRWNGQTYPGSHEPLVDRRTWERVQNVLEGRTDNFHGGPADTEFAYRGLISCGVCGCSCSPYLAKRTYKYYACSGARGCKRKNIREEEITRQIVEAMRALAIQPTVMEAVRKALSGSFARQKSEHQERQALLAAEHQRLSDRLERLYSDWIDGTVPASVYPRKKAEWEGMLADVELAQAAEQRANRASWEDAALMMETVSNTADTFAEAKPERKRAMLQHMVSNCFLNEGKVTLELRPWFKKVVKYNLQVMSGEAPEERLVNWLPAMDSNHD